MSEPSDFRATSIICLLECAGIHFNQLKSETPSRALKIGPQILACFLSEDVATFEVIVLNSDKEYFKFKWQVEKFNEEGPLKDCWLTTAVSSPISMGSSI